MALGKVLSIESFLKPKILKLSSTILLVGLIIGCQYNNIQDTDNNKNIGKIKNANDTIVVSNHPGVSIYKTKADYFNYISVEVLPDGRLNRIPDYLLTDRRIKVDQKGKITPDFRWYIENGYIVDLEGYSDASFTDINIQEYVDYNATHKVACWPDELIKPRIIDTNPFTEFYYMGCLDCKVIKLTLGEINEMIKNGTIEKYFTKLK